MRKIELPGGRMNVAASNDAGPAPMLQWLKIDDLVIDDSYQRELKAGNWKSICKIAAAFSWSRFSPVFVAPVEGGKYAIIDGQHRTHAALQCGFEQVPCQIVQMSREEQAQSFAAVNGMVTKVTVWNLLRAEMAAGVDWAVKLDGLAREAGCSLALSNSSSTDKPAGKIYAINGLRKLMEAHGSVLGAAMAMVRKADGYADVPEAWAGPILLPVLSALCQRPKALANPAFARFFELWPIWDEIDRIENERKIRVRRGLPGISKGEMLEASLIDWMDTRFKERAVA